MIENWAEIKQLILAIALMICSVWIFIMARYLKRK